MTSLLEHSDVCNYIRQIKNIDEELFCVKCFLWYFGVQTEKYCAYIKGNFCLCKKLIQKFLGSQRNIFICFLKDNCPLKHFFD